MQAVIIKKAVRIVYNKGTLTKGFLKSVKLKKNSFIAEIVYRELRKKQIMSKILKKYVYRVQSVSL